MKQPAKFSVVGVLLAVLAAIFYPTDKAAVPDPSKAPGGSEVQRPVEAPEVAAPGAEAPQKEAPKAQNPKVEAPKVEAPKAETTKPAPPKAEAPKAPAKNTAAKNADGLPLSTSKVGFTSRRSWESHFEKHGHEFGSIDADEYLARAKALRDAPLSADILEHRRAADGVYCRFHKKSGGFIAYHDDKTIRTYFRPNDGEAYYRRQLDRLPEDGR